MKEVSIKLHVLALVASTRALLGGGLGLLLADRLDKEKRKTVGWTLLMVGVVTTIPIGMLVLGKKRE
jgi:hypothetical protein